MRAWLDHLPELRIALHPGWYELPSHVDLVEARRLIELLARGVPGVETVVECSWAELDEVVLGPAGLVFVTVPEGVTQEAVVAKLKAYSVRLGIYQRAGIGHWPEVAWDEIEVKGPLVASLRKSLRSAEHPLARVGVGELPIELLAGATSEPIELLLLVEDTLELALRQQRDGAVDWDSCAHQAIGRRLARRLAGVGGELYDAVLACLASATDGTIAVVNHPREVEQLVRLGLAHAHGGDASLVPLARFDGAVEIIEQHRPIVRVTVSPPRQARARTPDEAFVSFDPRTTVQLGDPWFVDVRTFDPEVARVGRAVGLYLQRRDRGFVVEVASEPGSGANVMLRARLRELEANGLVTLTVDFPVGSDPIEEDFAVLLAVLRYYDSQPELVLAEDPLEAIVERLRVQSFALPLDLAIAEFLQSALADRNYDDDYDPELRSRRIELVADLRRQLAVRGQRLCLYTAYKGDIEHLPFRAELASDVHMLVSLPPSSAGKLRATNIVHLKYPAEQSPNVLRSILTARADLDAVFEDSNAAISRLLELASGNIGQALTLAHLACVYTMGPKVSTEDIERARTHGNQDPQ